MTGGIDLSVGSVAALASVVAALSQPLRAACPASLGGARRRARGRACSTASSSPGCSILPFIATLATMLAACGTALLLADNQSVSVSYDTGFTELGQGDFCSRPMVPHPGARIASASRRAYRARLGWHRLELHRLRPPRAGRRRQRGRGAADGPAGRPHDLPRLCRLGRPRRPGRRHPRGAVRRRPADRGRRLGALRHRLRGRRRHAADRRHRLGRRRRSPARCCSASSSTS